MPWCVLSFFKVWSKSLDTLCIVILYVYKRKIKGFKIKNRFKNLLEYIAESRLTKAITVGVYIFERSNIPWRNHWKTSIIKQDLCIKEVFVYSIQFFSTMMWLVPFSFLLFIEILCNPAYYLLWRDPGCSANLLFDGSMEVRHFFLFTSFSNSYFYRLC